MKLTLKVGLQGLVLSLVVMAACARRMTSKEIVDALMGVKSPERKTIDDDVWAPRRREPSSPGVKAHLVIYPDPAENQLPKAPTKKSHQPETKAELPILSHALDVLAAMRMSTRQGTKNVLRTAFPSLFEPDK